MHSHAPVRGKNLDLAIRYIRLSREAMDPSRKRKFDGDGDWGSHGGHWDRSGEKVQETQRDITTGTAQYSVADEVATLVEYTGKAEEAAVCEGEMVQTPNPPTNTGRKFGAAVRTFGKEVGRRRKNNVLGDGEKVFVRPYHQGAHSEAMPLALTGYSCGHAIAELTVMPCHWRSQ